MDELSYSASVDWGPEAESRFALLEQAKKDAMRGYAGSSALRLPHLVPLAAVVLDRPGALEALDLADTDAELAGPTARVMSAGHGKGARHMPYTVRLGPSGCVLLDVSPAASAERRRANLKVRISGLACTVLGVAAADALALAFVEWLGGSIRDRWPTRLDICRDEIGAAPTAFFDRVQAGRYVSTARHRTLHLDRRGVVQFAAGRSNNVRVSIYDKAKELEQRLAGGGPEDLLYVRAWLDRHGLDQIPRHCTRVEYQTGRAWLAHHGAGDVAELLDNLPAVVARLADDSRSVLRFTAKRVTDGNQARAGIMRRWAATMTAFRNWLGLPADPLPAPRRAVVKPRRAVRVALSNLTAAVVTMGGTVGNARELLRSAAWLIHNDAAGTLDELDDYVRDRVASYRQRIDASMWLPS